MNWFNNISGQLIKSWNECEKWCLDKRTFNGNLPLDILEVVEVKHLKMERKTLC